MHEIVIPGLVEAVTQKPTNEQSPQIEIFVTPRGLAHRVEFFDENSQGLSEAMVKSLQENRFAYMANGEHSPVRDEDLEDAQERSALLALRIEANPEKVNESLSSLAKVGMRALQALVYGQRIVISIESGFEETLRQSDVGALAQYEALRVKVDMLQRQYPTLINVLYDADEQTFIEAIKDDMQMQELPLVANRPITEREISNFNTERRKRLAKKHRYVTMGGSSSPFSKQVARQFATDQKLIGQVWQENSQVTALNEGYFKLMWADAYADGIDQDERLERMRQAFLSEQGHKDAADVLVWMIQSESVSKAAITEIGFLLMNAFKNGQQLILLMEPFDADNYIRHLLKKNMTDLQSKFPNDPLLDQLGKNEESVTYEMVMDSPLAATAQFKDAEAALRVRRSIEHELEDVQATVAEITGRHSVELFSLSKDVSDCIQKSRLVGTPESVEGRTEFYRNFDRFKAKLGELIKANPGQKDKVVQIINQAMAETVHLGPFAEPLKQHLAEATQTSLMLAPYMTGEKTGKPETPYLPKNYMDLITNVVTPLHDVLKFLGKPDAQAIPDHEVLMAYIANEFFPQLGFSPEEVDFISQVIGNHENIFKEKGRDHFAKSTRESEKGMALFFLVDSLTGALMDQDGKLALDPAKLESRFTDLYVRHMDPVSRKITLPRPEWGLYTVKDYVSTCRVMSDRYGVQFTDTFLPQIVDAALLGIKKTFDMNGVRANTPGNTEPKLSDKEIMKILEVRDELNKIKASL